MADPGRVGAALAELRTSTVDKLNAEPVALRPLGVPGATPNDQGGRVRLQSRAGAASGAHRPLQMELALFARGTHVFQVSVLGESVPPEAADTFIASIGFAR
jgi:hypothetical protein